MNITDPQQLGFEPSRLRRIDQHFQRYVDAGQLPGWQLLVSRRGQLAHAAHAGCRDIDAGTPFADDTVVRLFSMTKPVTSVAAMMLYEQGAFELRDPVAKFIPAFGDARVLCGGNALKPATEGLAEPMRLWHLLTHTAGLTYDFHHQDVSDALYRLAGFQWGTRPGADLATCCNEWAALPLAFQPGSDWLYSVASDVLGRVVEVASGMPLDQYFRDHIFAPLGMHDTDFWVRETLQPQMARLYSPDPDSGKAVISPLETHAKERPVFLSGGGGLWGTASDYLRFCHFLLNRGELDGARLLGSRTVDYMTSNHLPDNLDLGNFGRPLFSETNYEGIGFGLGFSVVLDPAQNRTLSSAGEYGWGGAASTLFWCDPTEDIAVVFLTQLLPSSTYPLRTQLKQLVYQALID